MTLEDFQRKAIHRVMEENGLEVLVASAPSNIYYLCGYKSVGQSILNKIKIYALYQKNSSRISLVIPYAEIPTALEKLKGPIIYAYGNFSFAFKEKPEKGLFEKNLGGVYGSPCEALMAALRGLQKKGRIGLDEGKIPPGSWIKISNDLSFDVIPAGEIFAEARMIKHPQEVEFLEKAAEIAEDSLNDVLNNLEIGMSENQLRDLFVEKVTEKGALPFFNVFTVDERSSFVDTVTTEKKVTEGSIIRADVGCVYKEYKSDIARTAVIGKVSTKVSTYYRSILEGEYKAISSIRPGIKASEVFDIAVKEVRKGIPHFERHHCGHGIGLEVYDHPLIGPGNDHELKAGMVICIETPYYEMGWAGLQIEDPVLVTEKGYRILTKKSRDLIQVRI